MTSVPAGAPPSETHAQCPAATDAYDSRTIQLHWITALVVALLWGIAEVIDWFPRGAPKIAVRSVHISLGVLLAVVVIRRLIWRSRSGQRLPPASGGLLGHAARISHGALYAALVAVVLLGISNAWVRGDSIFSLFNIPKLLPGFPSLKPTIGSLHKIGANVLVIMTLAHATAALFHHFVLRDSVLQRMLVRRETP
jgi:cytochrome b561